MNYLVSFSFDLRPHCCLKVDLFVSYSVQQSAVSWTQSWPSWIFCSGYFIFPCLLLQTALTFICRQSSEIWRWGLTLKGAVGSKMELTKDMLLWNFYIQSFKCTYPAWGPEVRKVVKELKWLLKHQLLSEYIYICICIFLLKAIFPCSNIWPSQAGVQKKMGHMTEHKTHLLSLCLSHKHTHTRRQSD